MSSPSCCQAQDLSGLISNFYSIIYALPHDPYDVFCRTDNGDSVAPGMRDSDINHELAQLLGLAHPQRLEAVAALTSSHR